MVFIGLLNTVVGGVVARLDYVCSFERKVHRRPLLSYELCYEGLTYARRKHTSRHTDTNPFAEADADARNFMTSTRGERAR